MDWMLDENKMILLAKYECLDLKVIYLPGGEEMEPFPYGVYHWGGCQNGEFLRGGFDQQAYLAAESALAIATKLMAAQQT